VTLLDTHVIIWLLIAPEKLSRGAREAVLHARKVGDKIAYSPVSIYEIAKAVRRGRIEVFSGTEDFVAALEGRLEVAPLSSEIAICAGQLGESFHGDPIDRMIAATAIVNGCTLITRDQKIREAGVCKTLW
jgi:PIN domain nuclease of toxin-antitoxin system